MVASEVFSFNTDHQSEDWLIRIVLGFSLGVIRAGQNKRTIAANPE